MNVNLLQLASSSQARTRCGLRNGAQCRSQAPVRKDASNRKPTSTESASFLGEAHSGEVLSQSIINGVRAVNWLNQENLLAGFNGVGLRVTPK